MKYLYVLLALFVIGALFLTFSTGNLGSNDLGITVTNSATTTRDYNWPVEVLANNTARQYARVCNDSDTIIYLSLQSATNTVALNSGIRLDVQGTSNSCFEINQDNLYKGAVMATSTVSGKNIIILEK